MIRWFALVFALHKFYPPAEAQNDDASFLQTGHGGTRQLEIAELHEHMARLRAEVAHVQDVNIKMQKDNIKMQKDMVSMREAIAMLQAERTQNSLLSEGRSPCKDRTSTSASCSELANEIEVVKRWLTMKQVEVVAEIGRVERRLAKQIRGVNVTSPPGPPGPLGLRSTMASTRTSTTNSTTHAPNPASTTKQAALAEYSGQKGTTTSTTTCYDTNPDAKDKDGLNCELGYDPYPSWCHYHTVDDSDFTPEDMCCVCGGGVPTTTTTSTCYDTNPYAKDKDGLNCEQGYDPYPSWCHYHTEDDSDFTPQDMCCVCGGGLPTPPTTTTTSTTTLSLEERVNALEIEFDRSGVSWFQKADDKTLKLYAKTLWLESSCSTASSCPGEGNLIVGQNHHWEEGINSIAVGSSNTLAGHGNFVGGLFCSSTSESQFSSILGGQNNVVEGKSGAVIGGSYNHVSEEACVKSNQEWC